jgi:hypothetical protein
MVLLLANISTRTAAQERHPLVRYMPFWRFYLRQFILYFNFLYALLSAELALLKKSDTELACYFSGWLCEWIVEKDIWEL